VLEENFKIQVGTTYVDIVNYTKIRKIEEKEIVVETDFKVIRVIGNNLAIQKLLQDEIFISGTILKIDLGSDSYA
jgi:hypothetical protein